MRRGGAPNRNARWDRRILNATNGASMRITCINPAHRRARSCEVLPKSDAERLRKPTFVLLGVKLWREDRCAGQRAAQSSLTDNRAAPDGGGFFLVDSAASFSPGKVPDIALLERSTNCRRKFQTRLPSRSINPARTCLRNSPSAPGPDPACAGSSCRSRAPRCRCP